MKRFNLFFVTIVTVLLTGAVLSKAGWLSASRASSVSRRYVEIGTAPTTQDASFREAAARWRRGQPSHWRFCLLQH